MKRYAGLSYFLNVLVAMAIGGYFLDKANLCNLFTGAFFTLQVLIFLAFLLTKIHYIIEKKTNRKIFPIKRDYFNAAWNDLVESGYGLLAVLVAVLGTAASFWILFKIMEWEAVFVSIAFWPVLSPIMFIWGSLNLFMLIIVWGFSVLLMIFFSKYVIIPCIIIFLCASLFTIYRGGMNWLRSVVKSFRRK